MRPGDRLVIPSADCPFDLTISRQQLNDPDFNMIIHTAPVEDENTPYFVWHIEIYPRLTTPAGFELGSGIFINVAAPEETAHLLREIVAAS